jgi:HlyD family secretion protein
VSQVRQQGVAESGVVSYTVVVEADNPGRQLLPGMTANAEIVLEQRENVLRLPNTALRFRPADPDLVAQGQALVSGGGGRRGGAGEAQAQTRREGGQRGEGRGQRAGGGQGRGVAQIAETLQLNEQQRAAAQTAFDSAMAAAPARGQGGGGDRRGAMRRIREQVIAAIEPTLTAQQRELLTQMRAGGGARQEVRQQAVVWVLRNNKPTPVQVEIGVADNGYTLMHSGLNEGDEVIIGGGPQAEEQQRPGGPFGGGGRGGAGGVRIRGG